MEYDKIKYIITTFVKKVFPEVIQTKFRWWLLNSDTQRENEQVMEELWQNSQGDVDQRTFSDLRSVMQRINAEEAPRRRHIGKPLLAAAALALLMVCSAVTYFVTRKNLYAERARQEFAQVTVPDGKTRTIYLADSTRVTINAGSTFIYPVRFLSDSRTVYLSGSANFEVRRNERLPFIVQTQHIGVTVLGTVFNVNAYPEAKTVTTTLERGSVQVAVNDAGGRRTSESYMIVPDQRLIYDKATGKVAIEQVDAQEDLSWASGYMIFDGSDFKEIISVLQHRYNINIVCSDIQRMTGTYYVHFRPHETLTDVLYVLNNLGTHFTYKREGNTLYIKVQ